MAEGRVDRSSVSQLYPEARILEPGEGIYEGVVFPRGRARPDGSVRPYVVLNMVSSVDGKAGLAGVASGIGSSIDRAVMRSLRSGVDAVMIGAGTLRAEKISLALDGNGNDQPVGIVVSSDPGGLPLHNLVSPGKQRVLILTTGEPGEKALDEGVVEFLAAPGARTGSVDLRAALNALARDQGLRTLLVEGGPSLNSSLLSLGLVDELFLTVAPKLLGREGGSSTTIVEGRVAEARHGLSLVSVFAAEDELFLRYSVTTT